MHNWGTFFRAGGHDHRATASAQGGRRGGTLRAGLDADPPNLDPHRSTAAVDRQIFQNLYDRLVDTDASMAIVPMLATSWSVSADGKTVRFAIRPGSSFMTGPRSAPTP